MAVFTILGDADDWGHMGGWGGGWMWLWGTLTMVVAIGLVVWLARVSSRRPAPPRQQPDPMGRARSVLAERYARGDLSTEDFRQRLDEIEQSSS